MEEARQHPPLTPEQWTFGSVRIVGLIALPVGLILSLAGMTDAFGFGLGLFVGSKVIFLFWLLIRPEASPKPVPKSNVALMVLVWFAVGVFLFVKLTGE